MAESIKTRPVHKDIKVLNKTVTAAEHMKNTYIRTKNQAEQTQVREQTNPVEYAKQQVTEKAERAVKGTVYQAGKQGQKAFYAVKERYQLKKESLLLLFLRQAKKKFTSRKNTLKIGQIGRVA